MNKAKQSGQTILVFLMILLVGFTIGLGIYLNSLTETSVSVKEQESKKSFDQAESGVDAVISSATGLANDDLSDYGIQNNVKVSETTTNQADSITFSDVATGVAKTVNLKEGSSSIDSVDISWTPKSSQCSGILVEILKNNNSNYTIDRSSYMNNSCSSEIAIGSPDVVAGSVSDIDTTNGLKMRIKPFGQSATIAVDGVSSVPQKKMYTVTGDNNSGEVRAIQVTKGANSLPEIFDYVLFSKSELVKNN